MKKILSLLKTSLSYNMSLFNVKSKNSSKRTKKVLPIFITLLLAFMVWVYANMLMESLVQQHLEFVLLTISVFLTAFLNIIEGIYKSSNLLFNCKDDDMLLSLPIKRSTVLFVRIFKFYVFELIYNLIVLLPVILVYIRYVNVGPSFYLITVLALLLLPIIPLVISCIIGGVIAGASSRFRFKNIAQIVVTMAFLCLVMYASYNLEDLMKNIAQNATSINDFITKLYYPAGAYLTLISDFNVLDLIVFILVHLGLLAFTVFILNLVYFKINTRIKSVKTKSSSKNKEYTIKSNNQTIALIKKELRRFVTSPVFVINAAFGLVLFIVLCVFLALKFDSAIKMIFNFSKQGNILKIKEYIPLITFGLICFGSLTSSITSSMISLEGKTFNILKSLPVTSYRIIFAKVLTAVLVIIPFILLGDIILFISLKFSVVEMIILLVSSIILPLVAELIGIIVNINHPKMDAENDTEVVKQSSSSMISVFAGFGMLGLTVLGIIGLVNFGLESYLILLIFLAIYSLICLLLLIYLKTKGTKNFEAINV